MKGAWFSITKNCVNYGNFLIEDSLRKLLNNIKFEEINFESFNYLNESQIKEINNCNFLIVPGCTTLQSGQNKAMEQLNKIKIPVFCFGSCFWSTQKNPDITIARNINRVIGSRDPFTYNHLKKNKIKTKLIGCPTLFINKKFKNKEEFILFCYGRQDIGEQNKFLEKLVDKYPVKLLIQEYSQLEHAGQFNLPYILEKNITDAILKEISRCSMVITGRLHAALPTIAMNIPLIFFSNIYDSRLSLLKFLGIPIYPINASILYNQLKKNNLIVNDKTLKKVELLKHNFFDYIQYFRENIEL